MADAIEKSIDKYGKDRLNSISNFFDTKYVHKRCKTLTIKIYIITKEFDNNDAWEFQRQIE